MFQCVNCGNPVENETAGTAAECCDACRFRWKNKAILEAIKLLTEHGYTVTAPGKAEEGK